MPNTTLEEVTNLAAQLSAADKLTLVENLARQLRDDPQADNSPSLRGRWKDKFPEDFDVDAALKEIRGEWLKELDELEAEQP